MKRSDLPIASPCTADWNTMTNAGRKRFCGECKKHVHDVSCMTREQAGQFVQDHAGENLCVRYAVDNSGNLLFAPRDVIAVNSLLPSVRALAAAAVVAAGVFVYQAHEQPQELMLMGQLTVDLPEPQSIPIEVKPLPEIPKVDPTEFLMGDVAMPEQIPPPVKHSKK
jgi:hypothetical protein